MNLTIGTCHVRMLGSQSGCVWDASSDWGGPDHRYSMELELLSSAMSLEQNSQDL